MLLDSHRQAVREKILFYPHWSLWCVVCVCLVSGVSGVWCVFHLCHAQKCWCLHVRQKTKGSEFAREAEGFSCTPRPMGHAQLYGACLFCVVCGVCVSGVWCVVCVPFISHTKMISCHTVTCQTKKKGSARNRRFRTRERSRRLLEYTETNRIRSTLF